MTIAVDFDGTIVEHRYPEIGKELPFATQTLKMLIEDRHKLILWSVREGKLLEDAVEWCRKRGVEFYAVNKDFLPSGRPTNRYSTSAWAPKCTNRRRNGGSFRRKRRRRQGKR